MSRVQRDAAEGQPMFTPEQYRAKANQYTELAKSAGSNDERDEFQNLQRSFSVMADNEQWLADNHDQTVHTAGASESREVLAAEEEHVLRCLGAALIMQWNAIPTKLQRELFDNAGSMGSLLDIQALRAQIARFLHKHKDDEAGLPDAPPQTEAAGSR
jgi:rubrerythrin